VKLFSTQVSFLSSNQELKSFKPALGIPLYLSYTRTYSKIGSPIVNFTPIKHLSLLSTLIFSQTLFVKKEVDSSSSSSSTPSKVTFDFTECVFSSETRD